MEIFNPINTSSSNHQFNKRRIYNMQKELDKINNIFKKNIINYNKKNLNTKDKLVFINSYNKSNNKTKPYFLDEILDKINIFDSKLKETSHFYILFEKVKNNFNERLSYTKIKDKHSIESYADLTELNSFSKVISDIADNIDYSLCNSIFKKITLIKSDMSLFVDMLDIKDNIDDDIKDNIKDNIDDNIKDNINDNIKDNINDDSEEDDSEEEDFFM